MKGTESARGCKREYGQGSLARWGGWRRTEIFDDVRHVAEVTTSDWRGTLIREEGGDPIRRLVLASGGVAAGERATRIRGRRTGFLGEEMVVEPGVQTGRDSEQRAIGGLVEGGGTHPRTAPSEVAD